MIFFEKLNKVTSVEDDYTSLLDLISIIHDIYLKCSSELKTKLTIIDIT